MCRNPLSSYFSFSCCGFPSVMVTASDWWLLSVAGLALWLRALLLAYFLLTSPQQLTQSISVLLNPFGSQDAPAKHIILRQGELSTAPKKAQQIRVTTCRGRLKTVFIIKGERSSERVAGLNCKSSKKVTQVLFVINIKDKLCFIIFFFLVVNKLYETTRPKGLSL